MPRIDPQQLLNCLQVLLSPTGGILSRNEVQRLANLMTKFSKKLVSKCIYVLILKNTERQLLGQFMGEGGWNLIHLWLQDAHVNKNWALVVEVLELLLLTPVDVERLKMNNLPKLVKGLSKREDLPGIQQLASSIVEQWLTIVKDVTKAEQQNQQQVQQMMIPPEQQLQVIVAGVDQLGVDSTVTMLLEAGNDPEPMEIDETISNDANTIVSENGVDTSLRFKFVRDCKQVISRVVAVRTEESETTAAGADDIDAATGVKVDDSEGTDKENSDKKQPHKSVPKKSSSSSSSSKSSSSSSRDKDRSRDKSKSGSSSSSRSSSSKSSSRDKDRRERDKHKHNGSSSSSTSSSSSKTRSKSSSSSRDKDKDKKDPKETKEAKEKQAEKDKDTLAKIQPQTLQKLGRIPKKTEDKEGKEGKDGKDAKKEPKKASFSVEVRKHTEEKPKTVKVYNSKMRSTGLMEEARPPPPRSATKKTATPPALPATIPTKRPSPIRDTIPPPEKKSRLIDPEKGGIKLIPPKPKPAVLQESDIFMDALTASATAKKEPKKRKRRTSTSKDSSPPTSPSGKQSTPTSPTVLKNITPANFYQDTLVTDADDDAKEKDEDPTKEDNEDEVPDTPAEPDDEPAEETTRTDANGLKGVLSYAKRKGPKRSLRWRPDAELVEVQYFELDETERVNVMKPFMDMQRMEMSSEREAMRQRKLPNEDLMEVQIAWRAPIEVECLAPPAELGAKSLEKNIQFAREKTVLQALYFNNRVPDTPAEPDHELHAISTTTAIVIPLHDPDQPEQDAPIHPWPEAKGSPPHIASAPTLFNNVPAPQFMPAPNAFPPNGLPQFTPAFGVGPPGMLNPIRPQGDWNMLSNGLPAKFPPPELLQQVPPLYDSFANGPVPGPGPGLGLHGPPGPGPDGPGGPGFPFQNGPNPMPQMFPPNNFNNNMRGRGGGGFRRGGPNNGPWLRMGAPNQGGGWNNQNRGRGFCNSFKQKGYCRNRDNCPYIH